MANIQQKNGVFHVRFRFRGRQFKKSLKTKVRKDAQDALTLIDATMVKILTGQLNAPQGVDLGDFIVSNGTLTAPPLRPSEKPRIPLLRLATEEFLESRLGRIEESYQATMHTHLGHLLAVLPERADQPVDRLGLKDLERYMSQRLKKVSSTTVNRERGTILRLLKWAVKAKYLAASPAADLEKLPEEIERDPFKTTAEIQEIIDRGGLSDKEKLAQWDSLYLSRQEIGSLLCLARERDGDKRSHMLHAIPAYTGMRRGEILKLRWSDIDFRADYIHARSRKQSRTRKEVLRRIDMCSELKQLLLAWRQSHPKGQYVLCDPETLEPLTGDIANRLFWLPMRHTNWCLISNDNRFKVGFHTYRHSFASNLACEGVDQRIIDQWMGHETEAMRRRYRHLFPNTRREAIRHVTYAVG